MKIRLLLLRLGSLCFPIRKVITPREKKIFQSIWHQIWIEEGYAQPEEKIVEKYARYDSYSVDFLITLFYFFPIGTIRIIHYNSSVGLPVLNDFEVTPIWKSEKLIEATLLTVKRGYRKRCFHLPSLLLMRQMYRYALEKGVEGVLIAADKRLFRILTKKLLFPFIQIGPEKFYEGSVTIPAYLDFSLAAEVVKNKNPLLYWFFTSSL